MATIEDKHILSSKELATHILAVIARAEAEEAENASLPPVRVTLDEVSRKNETIIQIIIPNERLNHEKSTTSR